MLGKNICGFAAFLEKESFYNNRPVFNLNGRNPNFIERILIRLKLLKYNAQNTMRRELYNAIRSSGAEMILVQYATTAHSLWDVISRFSIPVYIYVHGFDIIWDHNDDTGKSIHPGNYRTDISKIGKSSNITFIVSSNCSLQNLLKIDIEGAEDVVLAELACSNKLALIKQMHIEYHHHIIPKNDKLSAMLKILENANFGYQISVAPSFGKWPTREAFQDISIYCYRKH